MNSPLLILALLLASPLTEHPWAPPAAPPAVKPVVRTPDLVVTGARVRHDPTLDLLVFEMDVEGVAGGTLPAPRGTADGAPVLGYVFPTTLAATDAGFSATEGILALAVTSHPDFDDSPLWDENGDGDYGNDGLTWHTHWVVLVKDDRVPGGLAVKEFRKTDTVVLPPTAPRMPMYMDSPGYAVVTRARQLRVAVPTPRIRGQKAFRFDAVAAYLEVSHHPSRPMLGVYEVYSVLSKDLSLPFQVE
jgi:hypothetical protein